jgi:hypothetical protein
MTKRPASPTSAMQYDARAASDDGMLTDGFSLGITKAIFRDDQIVIDWAKFDGETTLTVLTKTRGSRYSGKSVWGDRTPREETAIVEAVLYSNDLGHLLIGEEKWSSGVGDWFVVQLYGGRSVQVEA